MPGAGAEDNRLLQAIEGMAVVYALLDAEGRIKRAGGMALLSGDGDDGGGEGPLLSRAPCWPDDQREAIAEDTRRALAGTAVRRRVLARLPGGDEQPVLLKIAPLPGPDGTVGELAVLATEMTDPGRQSDAVASPARDQETLRRVLDAMAVVVAVLDPDGTVCSVDGAILVDRGQPLAAAVGFPVWEWPFWADPARNDGGSRRARSAGATAVPAATVADRLRAAVRRAAGGVAERFDAAITTSLGGQSEVEVHLRPMRAADSGRPGALVLTVLDVSGRNRAAAQARYLAEESTHRSKNILGVVQSIARQMRGYHGEDFAEAFGDRLQSLARAQDFLLERDRDRVSFDALLRAQLAHVAEMFDTRILLSGPDGVILNARACQSLAIAINELATNAFKYGALSVPGGKVAIAWGLRDGLFWVDWRESGGPPVARPAERGFGCFVLEEVTARNLHARVRMDWAAEGVRWHLQTRGEGALQAAEPACLPAGARGCVLIAEDEPMLGHELAEVLRAEGFEVAGPASTLAEALALAAGGRCSAALLDLNLGGERADAVAELLIARGCPVVLVSAYPQDAWPETMRETPFVAKPVDFDELLATLGSLMPVP
jgi:two-component sensor histidine kinase/CheY-like chemotaxis protein